MSDQSINLSLPYILPSQAQKHVTHNEALGILDTLVQGSVYDQTTTEPPVAPTSGDAYIIGDGSTGDWAGLDRHLAFWDNTIWVTLTPKTGWRVWDQALNKMVLFDGTAWNILSGPLQNIDGLGINATSDTTNRLSVSSDATLFSHAGSDHQLKINKAATSDTASILYQSDWTGKIETGLNGNNDYSVKYSTDGITWNHGTTLELSSGFFGIGTSNPARSLHVVDDGPILRLQDNTATAGNGAITLHEFADSVSVMGWMGFSATAEHFYFKNNISGGDMRFIGGTTFTIAANGNTGIGTTAPTAKLHVAGAITCTSLTETSDMRMKTDIAQTTATGDLIDQISIVQYDWADGAGHVPYGVIAQDLAQILPDAVVQGDDSDTLEEGTVHWGVRQAPLVAMLIQEVQDLRKRIATLEAGC